MADEMDAVIEALAAQMSVEAFDRSLGRLIKLGLVVERRGSGPGDVGGFCPFEISRAEDL